MHYLTTIRDYIRWSTSQLRNAECYYGHGTDNALDDALMLVLHALSLDHSLPELYYDCHITEPEKTAIVKLIDQRISTRKPSAYLTGTAYFCGLPFIVNEAVLVPRSPFAELIEHGFSPWLDQIDVNRILDLCTGSGCIAIACAYAFDNILIDAIELSSEALEVAQQNCKKHQVESQVQLIQSDLFSALTDQKYDLIVSNPPYVSELEMQDLAPEFHQEPRLGLTSKENGLAIVKQILKEAIDYLTPQGLLIVEVGNSAEALVEAYPKVPFLWLDFERGGQGVFLLTAQQLIDLNA